MTERNFFLAMVICLGFNTIVVYGDESDVEQQRLKAQINALQQLGGQMTESVMSTRKA